MKPLPPRDPKTGKFVKRAPKPPPLDRKLVESLGSQVVPISEPENILESLRPRRRIEDDLV
jgi:hypothetical protein